ncbi:MAG: shikimate dehydrogenase [Faecalibacillus sp.]
MEKRITGHTELLGLIATPIRHSKSPTMHNAACQALSLDYAYLAFDIQPEQLEDAVKGFKALNVRGWNVSMPYKTSIGQYLDQISPIAKMCGAINTVINDQGVLTGTITDGTGYMRSLKDKGIDIIGKKMTIIGAGGAATAIVMQAAMDGVKEISIFNRKDPSWQRAELNVSIINEQTDCHAQLFDLDDIEALQKEIDSSVILTNATNVGMGKLEGMMALPDTRFLRKDLIVSDVIYMPEKTKLLEEAEKIGCTTINGLGMMLYQGAESFKLWTGKEMPIEVVKKALDF